MHVKGTDKKADHRISTPGSIQALRSNSDLPVRAWGAASTPSSGSKPIEAVFEHFVGQGYDKHERLMLKVRWFGYGPREDSWHFVEDLPAGQVRKHCMPHRLTV